jgi:small-conductance mechanosensitive channel
MSWNQFNNYEILQVGNFKLLAGNLTVAIIVVLSTWLFVSLLRRAIMQPRFIMDKINAKRRSSIFLISKYFIWVISLVIILEIIGIKITVILVGSTALLVGLGLGLQNIFKDLVSGLFLLFEGTIKIGDIIEADGVIGRVVEINLRSTELLTRDDMMIIVPNSRFVTEKVVNWSHNFERVRFKVEVGVSYGSDVEDVIKCLQEAMSETKEILNDPIPFVRFIDFGESALKFEMIFWSLEPFWIENVKSDLRRKVYIKLNEKGIIIPFPQRVVHVKSMDAAKVYPPHDTHN